MRTRVSVLTFMAIIVCLVGGSACAGLLDTPVRVNYTDKTINEVATDLGKQAQVGILVDSTAPQAKFSIDMGQTTMGVALDQICTLTGLFYGPVGDNSIVIASANPSGPYFAAVSQTRLVTVNNIPVKELLGLMSKNPYLVYMTSDDVTNQISIMAPPAIIQRIVDTIKIYDKEPVEVSFEMIFVDTSSVKQQEFNPNWSWTSGTGTTTNNPPTSGLQTLQFGNDMLGFTANNIWGGQLLMNLTSYRSNDLLKILAKPNITVMDGHGATIFCGTDNYVAIATIYGTAPSSVQAIKAGDQIAMKNIHVTDDNKIIIDMEADASEIVGTGAAGYPKVNRRTVTTTLRVVDGETIILGGLATNLDYWYKDKMPILGDLPIIGGLFRSSQKQKSTQEITILITPRILHPGDTSSPSARLIKKAKAAAAERTPVLEGAKASSPVENSPKPAK
jgi:type II secretory pathway component GspD/PulD (secretin)